MNSNTNLKHLFPIIILLLACFLPYWYLQLLVGLVTLFLLAMFAPKAYFVTGWLLLTLSALINNLTINAIVFALSFGLLYLLAVKLRLRVSKNLPELALAHTQEGILLLSPNGTVLFANKKAAELFGFDITNINFFTLLTEETKKDFLLSLKQKNRATVDFIYQEKLLRSIIVPFFEWHKVFYAVLISDVTIIKQTEEKLQDSLNLYQTVFDQASDAIFLVNTKENFTYLTVNDAQLKSTGLKREDIIGKPVAEIFPENCAELINRYQKALTTGKSYTYKEVLTTPLGKRSFLTTLTEVAKKDGDEPLLLGISKDITEAKLADQLFTALVASFPLGVIAFDLNGKILHANQSGLYYARVTTTEEIDMRKHFLWEDKLYQYILETGVTYTYEKRDNNLILRITLAPFMPDSEISGVLALLEDVTVKNLQENNLRKRNRELELLNRIQSREADSVEEFLAYALKELFNITSADSALACFVFQQKSYCSEIHGDFEKDSYADYSPDFYSALETTTVFHPSSNLFRIVIPMKKSPSSKGFIILSYFASALYPPDTEILELITGAISAALTKAALKERLSYLSLRDSQTGLYNRAYFDQILQNIGGKIGIFIFDLDNLKSVNDTKGHTAGDLLIKNLASKLKEFFADEAVVARIGGDEFAAVMEISPTQNLELLKQRVQETLKRAEIEASVGMATGFEPFKVFSQADDHMYAQKALRKKGSDSALP